LNCTNPLLLLLLLLLAQLPPPESSAELLEPKPLAGQLPHHPESAALEGLCD
jgi:hypothetical protein